MENQVDDVLTIDELSVYLKIPKSSLYKIVRGGNPRSFGDDTSMKMRTKLVLLVGCALLLGTGGCTFKYGNRKLGTLRNYEALEKGVYDKFGVYDQFGQPNDVTHTGQPELCHWFYYWAKMSMSGRSFIPYAGIAFGGYNTDSVICEFTFDSNDVMIGKDYKKDIRHINDWSLLGWRADKVEREKKIDRIQKEMEQESLVYKRVKKSESDMLDSINNHVAQHKN